MNDFETHDNHRRGHGRRHHEGRGPDRGEGRGFRRGPGPDGFGPEATEGFARPPFPGFGPEGGFGSGGPGRRRGPGRGRGPGRALRGDVRAAVLLLLTEEPMHGYQLMQTIADRTDGQWSPSPGAIYPTISQLEDEGLVTVVAEGGRKLVTLSEAGTQHVAEHKDSWPNPFPTPETPGVNLRDLVHQVMEATRQVGRSGTEAQRAAAAKVLATARRELYLLLADGSASDETAGE